MASQFIIPNRVIELNPIGKRQYKDHPKGRGIEIWDCEECHTEINNIPTRTNNKRLCSKCLIIRKRKRDLERYYRMKTTNS